MANLDNLRKITNELLANEVHREDYGAAWRFITLILDSVDSPSAIISDKEELLFVNKSAIKGFKEIKIDIESVINKTIKDSAFCEPLGGDCSKCPIRKILKDKEVLSQKFRSPYSDNYYRLICIPLLYDGISGVITILSNKNAE